MALQEDLRTGNVSLARIVETKNPRLLRWIPRPLLAYLHRILHLDSVNATLRAYPDLTGVPFAGAVLRDMEVQYTVLGLERVPLDGRFLFVSNHPLGGLDGMVLISAIGQRYSRVYFPVNDFLTLLPQFSDVFIPVNKHGAQSASAAKQLHAAYSSEGQVLYFPAGLCSRKHRGLVRDVEWKGNFVSKAIEYQRDVVPIYFEGQNSNFFYRLANFRRLLRVGINIEMLYLVDEMYRQHGAHLRIVVGSPIPWESLKEGGVNRTEWAQRLRERVYALGEELQSDVAR